MLHCELQRACPGRIRRTLLSLPPLLRPCPPPRSFETFVVQHLAWDWSFLQDYLRFFITGVTILVRCCLA